MKLAKVRAMVELEMLVPDTMPAGTPKNEEETDKLRFVAEMIRAMMTTDRVSVDIFSVKNVVG